MKINGFQRLLHCTYEYLVMGGFSFLLRLLWLFRSVIHDAAVSETPESFRCARSYGRAGLALFSVSSS